MNILFLDAYFEPEQIAFTHLEKDLLEGLAQKGNEIYIVCPTPTRGISREVAEKYRTIKSEELYNRHVHVIRFTAPQERKNPVIRAFRYFWCNIRTFQIGRRVKNVDAVFANSTPPTQGWIAGKVAKKLNVPFIFSLQDIFPDSLVNAGMTKEGSLIWRIGRWIENRTYEGATKIITISDGFKDNIIRKNVDCSKVVVIPNWIDTTEVYNVPRAENKLIKKYGLDPDKFYVCYSGNIGHSQNLELLVEAAREIANREREIEFVIIGEGAAKEQLQQMIEANEIHNVHLLPFQPYEDIAHVFSLGDAGLIISKPGIGGSSVPSKTWSIMAAKRPVLSSFDEGELTRIIRSLKCGLTAEAGNLDELVNHIVYLYENRDGIRTFADNGYRYVSDVISKSKCVNRYIEEIKAISE